MIYNGLLKLSSKIVLSCILVSIFYLCNPGLVYSQVNRSCQVIIVVCDYLELTDLNNPRLSHLREFFHKGSVALLNTNTAGSRTRPNVAATVSAGNIALGTVEETLAFGPGEFYHGQNPLDIFQARTGFQPGAENLVVFDYPLIIRQNEMGQVKATPGALGEALHNQGIRTGVLGNSDLPGLPQRTMSVIAMDTKGMIDTGDVSTRLLEQDKNSVIGYHTDYNALQESFLEMRKKAQLLVIELGDLVRLEQNRQVITDSVYFAEREHILEEYDSFIGWLLKSVNARTSYVMVASLSPSPVSLKERKMFTFIGVQGRDIKSGGLLFSPTTRREGIATLYDIAPSILQYYGAPVPSSMLGRPWYSESVKDNTRSNLEIIQDINTYTTIVSNLRPPLVKGYVVLHLLVLAGVISCLVFGWRKYRYFIPFLVVLITMPLAWLIEGFFFPLKSNIFLYILEWLVLSGLFVFVSLAFARNKKIDPVLFPCLATVGILLTDTVAGGNLQKYSVLSYDPIAGARFYGIGNEYMGVLVGATIMGVSLLMQRLGKISWKTLFASGVLFFSVMVVIGLPQWGSNFGGILASLVSFVYTFLRLYRVRIRFREILVGGIIMFAVCSGFLILDYLRPPELRSHFGQLIYKVQSSGVEAFGEVIVRKLSMNYRLIKYTIWTRVLIGTLLALGILFYRPIGIFKQILNNNPALAAGLEGSLVGAFAALIFNDSGIVAAATSIIFPSVTLFFLVLREQETLV